MTPSKRIRGGFTEEGCPGKLQAVGTASVNVNKRNSIVHLQDYKWFAAAKGRRRVRYGAELEKEAGAKSQGALPTRLNGLYIMLYTKASHTVITYKSSGDHARM